jgi:hypothetical protein
MDGIRGLKLDLGVVKNSHQRKTSLYVVDRSRAEGSHKAASAAGPAQMEIPSVFKRTVGVSPLVRAAPAPRT